MDKELELENKFIQLWNDGNSYDEISEEIDVDIDKIKQWGTDLIVANNGLFDDKKYVLSKLEDGEYVLSNGGEFPERVLFKLEESKNYNDNWDFISFYKPKNAFFIKPYKIDKKIVIVCNSDKSKEDNLYGEKKLQNLRKLQLGTYSIHNLRKEENYEFQFLRFDALIGNGLESLRNTKSPDLPIEIKRFAFQQFNGIKEIKVNDLPVGCQWIFLTGENGYGKTTVLKAIAISLYTKVTYQNGNFHRRLAIEFLEKHESGIRQHINEPFNSSGISRLHNLAAYGPTRLTLQEREAQNEESRRSKPLYSLFHSDGILLNIEYRIFISSLKDKPKFEKIKQLLISVVPDLKDIIVDKDSEETLYIEKSFKGKPYKAVKFDELAAGYKSVIAMVGDIYLRLSKHQPDKEIKDLGGIVIIDELDVHLHPKWQRKLPKLLSDAFPKVQFIAATHSPIPFLGAPKNAVFLKVDRTPEEGITCERIDIDVTNLTPNLILTSPIFGFDEIISDDAKKDISEVRTEDSYEELKKNKALRERLLEFEKSKREFPDELFEQNANNPTESK